MLDLSDPRFCQNPYPFYERLRVAEPTVRTVQGPWVLTRYEDVMECLRDPANVNSFPFPDRTGDLSANRQARLWMAFTHGQQHRRIRQPLLPKFSRVGLENVEQMLGEIVEGLLEAVRDRTEFELVSSFSYRLPYSLTCYRMQIPRADWDRCGEWTAVIERIVDPNATPDLLRDCSARVDEMEAYFKALLTERRRQPGSDLISHIATMEYEGQRLSDPEALATIAFIFLAGQGSTVLMTVNGMLALIRHPDQMKLVREDPSLTKAAVEEILRLDAPSQFSTRFTTEPRNYSGTTIPAGEVILPSLAAASRDPAVYPDPDRLDIQRPPIRIPAFGQGPHLCLGATVARELGEVAIRGLLDSFDPIELAMNPDAIVYDSIMARGPRELHISVGHATRG